MASHRYGQNYNIMSQRQYGRSSSGISSNKSPIDYKSIVFSIAIICASFYGGAISGKHAVSIRRCPESSPLELILEKSMLDSEADPDEEKIEELVEEKLNDGKIESMFLHHVGCINLYN